MHGSKNASKARHILYWRPQSLIWIKIILGPCRPTQPPGLEFANNNWRRRRSAPCEWFVTKTNRSRGLSRITWCPGWPSLFASDLNIIRGGKLYANERYANEPRIQKRADRVVSATSAEIFSFGLIRWMDNNSRTRRNANGLVSYCWKNSETDLVSHEVCLARTSWCQW